MTYVAQRPTHTALQHALLTPPPQTPRTPAEILADRLIHAWPQAGHAARAQLAYTIRAAAQTVTRRLSRQIITIDWPTPGAELARALAATRPQGVTLHITHVHRTHTSTQTGAHSTPIAAGCLSTHVLADTHSPTALMAAAHDAGLNPTQPVTLLLPHGETHPLTRYTLAALTNALPPRSHLAITHLTLDHSTAQMERAMDIATAAGVHITPRRRGQIEALLAGQRLVPPGLHQPAAGLPILATLTATTT